MLSFLCVFVASFSKSGGCNFAALYLGPLFYSVYIFVSVPCAFITIVSNQFLKGGGGSIIPALQRQRQFEDSLAHRVKSRTARAPQRKTCFKTNKTTTEV